MNIVFICNSPFQLLSSICIKEYYHKNDFCKVVLTDAAKALKEYDIRKVKRFFDEADYLAIYEKMKNLHGYKDMELPDERVTKIVAEEIAPAIGYEYDHIYYANLHAWIYYTIRCIGHAHIRSHYYEDGMDSYIKSAHVGYGQMPESLFVYEPKMMPDFLGLPVKKIPAFIEFGPDCRENIYEIFKGSTKRQKLPANIYFEQHSDDKNDYRAMDDLFLYICRLTENDIILKSHPRRKKINPEIGRYRWKSDMPWEMIACRENLQGKILFNVSSRAVFTTPVFTNDRPVVILLYRILILETGKPLEWWHINEEYVRRWAEMYGKDRVFIPGSREDLQKIMNSIRVQK